MRIQLVPLFFVLTYARAQGPMPVPDTLSGSNFTLQVYDTVRVFYPGYNTATYGFNGSYLGPTLLFKEGDSVSVNVINNLADTTTVHWHGLHVSSSNDGGPHTTIAPGAAWHPKFRIRNHPATFWYHSHLHMMTNVQVTKGMAGLIIVRDSVGSSLQLPHSYGTDDFPVIVQSRHFDQNKQLVANTASDSVIMVNGAIRPYLEVPAQVVRLRLLNGASDRVFNFGLTANKGFHQIASDGGLLPAPVPMTRLRLGPGERAEILIDLAGMQGQTADLVSYGAELPNGFYGSANPAAFGPGTIAGYAGNPLNGTNYRILRLQVVAQTANPVNAVPVALVSFAPLNPSSAVITRTLTFTPQTMGPSQMLNGPFVINNLPFNMNFVNITIPQDNTEIWELRNQTAIAHPFHIHDAQFSLISLNGLTPPLNMQGYKDVVLVPAQQTARFIARFENFCEPTPYMYHCHMLKHEDEGMMGQFVVECPPVGIGEEEADGIRTFPNPASGELHLTLKDYAGTMIRVFDATGKLLMSLPAAGESTVLDVSPLSPGLYFLELTGAGGSYRAKALIER